MSTAARIDELRKKFEENPRRYFAPLANELRKAGTLTEAIALCREFLPKQPEHMSGYIVFGQALYESGELSEARTVFEQALALDPENLKALRHLGDIAKLEGDTLGARRWYERVLEADPRNDDIAAQLATLATPASVVRVVPEAAALASSVGGTPPSSVAQASSPLTPPFSMAPIGLGATPTPDAALRSVDFEAITARLRVNEAVEVPVVASDPIAASEGEVGEAVDGPVESVGDDPFAFSNAGTDEGPFEEGLIAPEWPDTTALVARVTAPRPITPPLVAVMTPDAVAAFGLEPGDPRPARAEHDDLSPLEPADTLATDIAIDGGMVEAPEATVPLDETHALYDDVDPDSLPLELRFGASMPEEQNPAFLTETMGELLVSQGFTARAVTVYEELVRRRPYDPMLTSRLAELQVRLAAEAVPAEASLPVYPSPFLGTPAIGTAAGDSSTVVPSAPLPFATPLSATPIGTPVHGGAESSDAATVPMTARERFSRLALRRVPRRTPPRASAPVDAPSEGLAALFGGAEAPEHDDRAARALADAFAPMDETTQVGGASPFEEVMLGGVTRVPTPIRPATPIASAAVRDSGGPFSFDRFFPDPASAAAEPQPPAPTPSETLASAPAPDPVPPTVSDDLAQFSAWLKGLGNP